MPKKSTKSKSKRTTLKQKYKVIRKVKEHHKKKRKRKHLKKLGIKPKKPKGGGVPANYPDELIKEISLKISTRLHQRAEKLERNKKRLKTRCSQSGVELNI